MKLNLSLEAQIGLMLLMLTALIIFLVSLFNYWIKDVLYAALFSSALVLPIVFVVLRYFMSPINRVLSALKDGFYNFLDNDFSVSIAKLRNDEFGQLIEVYNKVSETLRDERVNLYQRELLLDTVIQTTPLALVLTDTSKAIIYSNSAACKLFNSGRAINGFQFSELLNNQPSQFLTSVESGLNGLFTVSDNDNNETYHLTQNQFLLNGLNHRLYLFKSLTKEINRQEVNTWKKVIRLISHELNNSLAPITSLAHSGQLLSESNKEEKLGKIFATMGERARYLQSFIEGYAKFARLPKPKIQAVAIVPFLKSLQQIKKFELVCENSLADTYCDPGQMQQVIINLIKNAHESGSKPEHVRLIINVNIEYFEILISDRGKGMSDKNLNNALLPFYSTKSDGTGLGLPLCREIIEAHGGKMMINNRLNGGIKITLIIPNFKPNGLD